MCKQILRTLSDILTVALELEKMKVEYQLEGYCCELLANCLKIELEDGYAMIFWENGAFFQECHYE